MKQLIVNADDYGLSTAINAGIVETHQRGIVTSTTIIAYAGALNDGLARLRDAPDLDTGCHLVLIDGEPTAQPSLVRSLLDPSGRFPRTLSSFLAGIATGRVRHAELVVELRAQLERLLGYGLTLSHCDTHKHTHAHPRVLDAVLEVVEEYKIPYLRMPFENLSLARLHALSYATGESIDFLKRQALNSMMNMMFRPYFSRQLRRTLVRTPEFLHGFVVTGRLRSTMMSTLLAGVRDGVNELLCHPARAEANQSADKTLGKMDRVSELKALCSTEAKQAVDIEHIELISYRQLADSELVSTSN